MLARILPFLLAMVMISPPGACAQTAPDHPGAAGRIKLPATPVEVTMGHWGGRPVVEARINGQGPFKLLIDTGTTYAAIVDDALVTKLKLPVAGSTRLPGEETDVDVLEIATLAIGDAEFSSVRGIRATDAGVAFLAGEGIRGILGLRLFQDCLLTLDFPKRHVRLESGELPAPDGETVEYSADEKNDYGVTVTLSLAGVPVKAHLDTGSPALVTMLNKLQEKLPLKGKPQVVGRARTPQGEAEVRSATLAGVLRLGQHEWTNPRINFADLGPMVEHDAGNIGSRLLREFAVTLDQKNHRVRFRRGGSDRESP